MRLGLRARVTLFLAALLALGGAGAWLLISYSTRDSIAAGLQGRTVILGQALAASTNVELAVLLGDGRKAQADLDAITAADPETDYVVLLDPREEAIAWSRRGSVPAGATEAQEIARIVRDHLAGIADDALVRGTTELRAKNDSPDLLPEPGDTPTKTAASAKILIGMNSDIQVARMRDTVWLSMGGWAGTVMGLIWIALGRAFRRLDELRLAAVQLAQGDLRVQVETRGSDEIAQLARAVGDLTASLGQTIRGVRGAADELEVVGHETRDASVQIAADAHRQATAVEQTAAAFARMAQSSDAVEAAISKVNKSAQTTSDRMREISAGNSVVSSGIGNLGEAANQTQRHLDGTLATLDLVAGAVGTLQGAATETAAAMAQIADKIRVVEQQSARAQEASGTAASRAASGATAVRATAEGIQQTRVVAQQAVDALQSLTTRVASIERFTEVIDNLAAKTKLLSLNASIIAAQAGEHGSGFLVVAEEVKALATQTGGSTGEITRLIREAQAEANQVLASVIRGVHTVDDAVRRSQEAEQALSAIVRDAEEMSTLIRAVTAATAEQTRSSARVASAMAGVQTTSAELRDVVDKQRDASGKLGEAILAMRRSVEHALAGSGEQSTRVNAALSAVDGIFEQVRRIAAMNAELQRARSDLLRTMGGLTDLSTRNRESARRLEVAVGSTTAKSEALSAGVRGFTLEAALAPDQPIR